MYTIETINDSERFYDLEETWTGILEKVEHTIFQTYDYGKTWWEIFGKKYKLNLMVVKNGPRDSIAAIIPLYEENRPFSKIARIVGDRNADYINMIFDLPVDEMTPILEEYFHSYRRDIIHFNSVIEGSKTQMAIEKLGEKGFQIFKVPLFKAPKINLVDSWEDFYDHLEKKIRSDNERQLRRLRNLGDLQLVPIKGVNIDKELDTFFLLHSKRWAPFDKKPLFSNPLNRMFYSRIARLFDEKGFLAFSKLMCGEKIVAMHFGFIYRNTFYYYIPVYDPAFRSFSAGRLLLLELIKRSFKEAVNLFDLMAGDEPYKSKLANSSLQLNRFLVLPASLRGRLHGVLKFRIWPVIKGVRKKMVNGRL